MKVLCAGGTCLAPTGAQMRERKVIRNIVIYAAVHSLHMPQICLT